MVCLEEVTQNPIIKPLLHCLQAPVRTYDVPRVNAGDGDLMALAASVQNLTAAASRTTDLESGLRKALEVTQYTLNNPIPICERVRFSREAKYKRMLLSPTFILSQCDEASGILERRNPAEYY
jgi:hypothetical protein